MTTLTSILANHLMPWIALTPAPAHELRRVAGFLYGWWQREHQLNLRAADSWWLATPAAEREPRALGPGARARRAHDLPARRGPPASQPVRRVRQR